MEVIEIHHPYNEQQIPEEEVVLVLGFFDGVHCGHQEVIRQGQEEAKAKGLKLAVMTFNQHPSIVFQKINPATMKYLTTIEQKAEHMKRLGVDYLYVVEFTSAFAGLSPQTFVNQYMIGLHARVVVAGFDYTYGPRDIATMNNLPNYVKGRLEIVTVPKQVDSEQKISSTAIREQMQVGNMEQVTRFLGYPYEIEGTVVHGDARGRTLGFPTANIKVSSMSRLPRKGVYAVTIQVAGKWYCGMAQIGRNITFEPGRDITVEVNILDFNQDIYGEQVRVAWHHYLRDEVKFSGVEGLISQLKQDQVETENYFSNWSNN
ncbi:riboflavin biosynthesis protein RibF [Vagococcus intermedius]|uniref:Riboflavin biosynthesis protein n=1 Tax=Vagococcus intermedius TaxID=2991418 RepID=A0AAF0I8Q1_9ENTE|nr:riboflavin biosynthesis protein RibF [Vagococcus intermedius]WEG72752.1 riboflavin biosynthesis protein RibF [Vagococcus intermedius]WEG74838.1 riboflavin biosynthesis protein RibF [Vagococcus intermedius]